MGEKERRGSALKGRVSTKQVYDALEECEETALTIHGKGRSFQDFINRYSKEEVTEFFVDVIQLLTEKGIDDYHLVLSNSKEDIHSEDEEDSDLEKRRRRKGGREYRTRSRSRRRGGGRDSNDRHHRHRGRSRSRSRSPARRKKQRRHRSCWKIVVYHGGDAREKFGGPIEATRCMSCDLRTSMKTGLTGEGEGGPSAYDSLIYEDEVMRYWHDAKGRALFVVTPLRHVRDLKELTLEELYQLWAGAVHVMKDMHVDAEDMRDMIVNAGVDQNHLHLHLKVRVNSRAFERARTRWSSRRNRVVDRLRDFADSQDV